MLALSRAKWPILALFAGLCASAAFAFPFSVDDAYITARYARRIAQGLGYTFNDGATTDGVTGPLWLLPLVLSARLGLDPLAAGKLLGLLCSLLACAACVVRARSRARGPLLAWATASFCMTATSLCVWSVAGLETGAATLALTGISLFATARGGPRGLELGLCIACAAWLRPEMAVAALTALVCAFVRDRKAACVAFLLGATGACALLGFRQLAFGGLLPLSFYAKPAEISHGVRYALSSLRVVDTWLVLALLGLAVRAGRREERMHAAIVASHVLACVLAGGDWMPGQRLFVPLLPVTALSMAIGLRSLRARRPVFAGLVWGATLLVALLTMTRELPEVRAAGENRIAKVQGLVSALGPAPLGIAVVDIGAIGYFSHARIVDLGGLVEPVLAHAKGGHLDKRVDEAWFSHEAPHYIVLHSEREPRVAADGQLLSLAGYPVEARVARMPLVRASYRSVRIQRYGPRYFYVILARSMPAAGPQPASQVKPERTAWDATERIDLGRRASLELLAP